MKYNEQSKFLASCMEISEPKRRTKEERVSTRQCTVKYSFLLNGTRKQVCQKMLCSVLRITRRRAQMIVEKLKSGSSLNDLRGKHHNRPHKIPCDEIELIKEHISSFPCQESHYSRSSNKKIAFMRI